MQKLLMAGTMILGLFLAGCNDSGKDAAAEQGMMDQSGNEAIQQKGHREDGKPDNTIEKIDKSVKEDLRGDHAGKERFGMDEKIKTTGNTSAGEVTVVKKEVTQGPVMLKARHRDLEISSKYARCVKSGKTECLLIREVGQEKWTVSARQIQGFKYEPGYHYLIRVKEKVDDNNVPRWKLVKIMNRELDK